MYAPGGVDRAIPGLLWGAAACLLVAGPVISEGFPVTVRSSIAGLLACAVGLRACRRVGVRVETSARGVAVINTYRTRRIPWAEVDAVAMQSSAIQGGSEGDIEAASSVSGLPPQSLVVDDEGEVRLLEGICVKTRDKWVMVEAVNRDVLYAIVDGWRFDEHSRAAAQ